MTASSRTSVLIVDDSPTARLALRRVIESADDLVVVGEAPSGARAMRMIAELKPQLVTMDVHLGKEHGIDVTAEIMSDRPTPILIVTAADPSDGALAFRAIEAGALDLAGKPPAPDSPDYSRYSQRLQRLIRSLARVPVVTRRRAGVQRDAAKPQPREVKTATAAPEPKLGTVELVVIGASTGGPPVLQQILSLLPKPYRAPVAIAQHVAPGFVESLATWLSSTTGHDVGVCSAGERLQPNRVYLARDGCHLKMLSRREIGSVPDAPRNYQRPSIDELFESAAKHVGRAAVGVLLTGMGSDGAQGLSLLRSVDATTIVQDPRTCAVDSMPRNALDLGAARWTLDPEGVANALIAAPMAGLGRGVGA